MATQYIDPKDDLMRCVPWGRLRKDENDDVVGIEASAFRLRTHGPAIEEYLSAGWVQFFDGSLDDQIVHCVKAFRKSRSPTSPKSGFAVGNVAAISAACETRGKKIRVIHEPTSDNAAHVAVRQWPLDDDLLFEELARSIWARLVLNKDIAT
jgi:hypothetical protein